MDKTVMTNATGSSLPRRSRQQQLQGLGIFCGLAAALWLAAAEAPGKLVTVSVSPFVISFMMVLGAFVSRWSVPALVRGTSDVVADTRQVSHLIVWGILAGCLWAVGNTLTIFAIRDVGLSIAFPLWNCNSLVGIFWGVVLFRELRGAPPLRKGAVVTGAVLICGGAVLLALASSAGSSPSAAPLRGVLAAVGAGVVFGSMYIPYRKAYLTGMNPLTFLTYFTAGELITMTLIAVSFEGGLSVFWGELVANKAILFWPFLGGLLWVIGDLLQNYAAKYIGISRGIPLSNTNQLWGLLWGVLVFGELQGQSTSVYAKVIGGSLLMVSGAAAIACSSATKSEYQSWKDAAQRESERYCVDPAYVASRMEGHGAESSGGRRTWVDYLLITIALVSFIALASVARVPSIALHWGYLAVLVTAMIAVLAGAGTALWRMTRFE
ncbi:MAG TPA: GRP family sugar transporter [Bryobacteraceae bacterium]|nr:GRP family sugar transporter [Bryobacteraceae bacterium]